MKIEQLHSDMILITLGSEDLSRMGLSFERLSVNDTTSRRALIRLLLTVCRDCGIDCRRRRFLIEALPSGSQVLLLVSMPRRNPRKVYRIKRPAHTAIYVFSCVDDMLDGIRRCTQGTTGALYRLRDEYIFIPDSPCDIAILCEYADIRRLSPLALSKITERASLVMKKGALSQLVTKKPVS